MSTPLHSSAAVLKLKQDIKDIPEHRLMFAIIEQAIMDLTISAGNRDSYASHARESAIRYFNRDIPHATWCDLDPQHIKYVLRKLELI